MRPLRLLPAFVLLASLTSAAFAADPTPLQSAQALVRERKLPEAQAAFEKLAAADPRDAEVQFWLGAIALNRGESDRAIAFHTKATELAPAVAKYQLALGNAFGDAAQKASVFSQPGLAKKCKAAYDRAVALEPANVDCHQAVFDYCRQAPSIVGGGADKAEAEAATMLKLNPLRGHQAYVTLSVSQKKFPDALTHAAEIKKLDDAAGRFAYVLIYTQTKEWDQALAQLDEALAAKPDDYAALYSIGRFAAMSGQYLDRGLAALRRCLELTAPSGQPGPEAVHWRIGNLLEKKNDPAGARAAYEAALTFNPNFKNASDALKKLK